MHRHYRHFVVALASVLPFFAFAHEHEGESAANLNHDDKHVGPHGGIVKSIGKCCTELVFDLKAGRLSLYVLEADAKNAKPIPVEKIAAHIKIDDDFEPLIFVAAPLAGETKNTASCFAAAPDYLQRIRRFNILMIIPIDGEKHRTEFTIDLKGPDKTSRMRQGHSH